MMWRFFFIATLIRHGMADSSSNAEANARGHHDEDMVVPQGVHAEDWRPGPPNNASEERYSDAPAGPHHAREALASSRDHTQSGECQASWPERGFTEEGQSR